MPRSLNVNAKKNKMRIGLDLQPLQTNQATGLGYYLKGLHQALIAQKNKEEIVGLKGHYQQELTTYQRFLHDRFELPRLARQAKVDVLHQPGFSCPKAAMPVVWTLHDLRPITANEKMSVTASLFWKWWLPRSARYADAIVCISESTKADAKRYLPLANKRIEVIPVGVPEEVFEWRASDDQTKQTQNKFHLTQPYLVAIGTIQPVKNYPILTEVLVKLRQESGQQYQLVIVGKKGWGYSALAEAIKSAGLIENQDIIVTDYVTEMEKLSLIKGATTLVMPSLYEGFGIPIVEAQALGVPVLVSNTSSMPEVAGEGQLTADPHNAESWVKSLIEVQSQRSRLIDLGKKNIERFRWNNIAKQWLELYRSLV